MLTPAASSASIASGAVVEGGVVERAAAVLVFGEIDALDIGTRPSSAALTRRHIAGLGRAHRSLVAWLAGCSAISRRPRPLSAPFPPPGPRAARQGSAAVSRTETARTEAG